MNTFLPLFPLKLVAFPGEQLNLHIFEERYKQLINECINESKRFGIPAYLNNQIEYGTEISVERVGKAYADGQMDIVTIAHRVFRVIEFYRVAPGKLYAGGDVVFLDNIADQDFAKQQQMVELTLELFDILSLSDSFTVGDQLSAFDIGHKIGLSNQKKYELLQIEQESSRQQFVIDHLKESIPVVRDMESARERIRMNGHFRKFDPLDF
ncbi:LON peptidase substrate-binding domain-containing protein [Tunicatimonas pelagia]|uniref:LON peptidase substrate-binding domain-containing protein n=1 Tax=Tunicatimonas pelagia TaxID=931531 RepID=UPI002666A565|nr:LON peptidase substrate-binding domain-containing protein [Tunicatimonas pelagia]WKN46136.1 LON peptidase substrate-binding domain-containing protein [Tunicatimonas pelagia]